MSDFKVGDMVRRISNEGSHSPMPIGAVYRVAAIRPGELDIRLVGDVYGGYRAPELFELAAIESAKDMDKLYETP